MCYLQYKVLIIIVTILKSQFHIMFEKKSFQNTRHDCYINFKKESVKDGTFNEASFSKR